MKKKMKLIAAMLLLVIVVGAYVGILLFGPKEEDAATTEEEKEDITAYTIDENNITKIHVANEASETPLTFVLDGDNWYCKEAKNCKINQYKITAMIDSVKEVEAEQKIDKGMENEKEFGLDQPSTTITISLKDGSEVVYTLGTLNNVLQQYYFNVKGQNDVYMISTVMYNSFDYDILGLAELTEYPSVASSDILQLDITSNGKTYYCKDKAESANKKDQSEIPKQKWVAGNSLQELKKTDQDAVADLLQEVSGLTSSACINYDYKEEELKKYGLTEEQAVKLHVVYTETHTSSDDEGTTTNAPESTETVDTTPTPETTQGTAETENPESTADTGHMVIDKKEFTVYIGKENDGERYVRLEGTKQIDKMNLSGVEKILEAVAKK